MNYPNIFKTVATFKVLCSVSLAASLALTVPVHVNAQENRHQQRQGDFISPAPGTGVKPDWKLSASLATLYMPAFTGSKDDQALVVPDIKVEYQDVFFASLFEGIGYNIINSGGWRAGPIVKLDIGRDEDDDNPFRIAGNKTRALRGLGDVSATPELGGFVEYSIDRFSYSIEVRQGVSGHKGLIADISAHYMDMIKPSGQPVTYLIGPHVTLASGKYNNTYFGIDESQSANTGLQRYKADAGLVSYGVSAFVMTPVTDALSLGLIARYDRLGSEAADSPLIQERGRKNQFIAGVRLTYEFGL
ncbi:MipA/OmpV family protein [Niveispirillum irakense]|uniref:MipA/OmpV family protein n=1 Tax=Niveispirillum irakense TaxID=34011 RepID=UPI00040C665A|nr:MipA/OmpV family protein [Niveispirillum irakense]